MRRETSISSEVAPSSLVNYTMLNHTTVDKLNILLSLWAVGGKFKVNIADGNVIIKCHRKTFKNIKPVLKSLFIAILPPGTWVGYKFVSYQSLKE